MTTSILQRDSLPQLLAALRAAGQRVIAPVRQGKRTVFAELPDGQAPAGGIQTAESPKTVVFPRYEPILSYRFAGKDVQPQVAAIDARPTVLFGARPCDAASFATLRAVFTWDSPDAYFEPKLANLTVIGAACTECDEYCFCTSVGGGPGSTAGSDILLTAIDAQRYLAEVLTEKGQAVVQRAASLFTPADGAASQKDAALAKVKPRFDAADLGRKLPAAFAKEEVWKEQSLRCLGCGACAYVCPTCSCFDIQDERDRTRGVRLRCWDSCGFGLFTLHASGHNPRHVQSERWRQRVMHKFSYQPERQGVLGCVGCGRCSRACPVDMNLAEHAAALAAL